jgi:metallophosphoesterase (TIGR00282 family)
MHTPNDSVIRLICIGDIVGQAGRRVLAHQLPNLRSTYSPHFIVANVENSSNGSGITWNVYEELVNMGIDIMTGGNHIFAKQEFAKKIDQFTRVIRPLNFPKNNPGVGYRLFQKDHIKVGVINIIGRVFMNQADCPFHAVNDAILDLSQYTNSIIVDFHAETTSEKKAMAFYLDGKVSCVFGTHTHVQTADEWILPGHTAAITDLGMTGSMNSVLGVQKEIVIERFLTQMPRRFETSKEFPWMVNGIYLEIDAITGHATRIERILRTIDHD